MVGFFLEEENFGEIKGHDQASEKTKELAAEGEGLMNRIESEATNIHILSPRIPS